MFHRAHEHFFWYRIEGGIIEVVHLSVSAAGPVPAPHRPDAPARPRPEPVGHRRVRFRPSSTATAAVYRRADLGAGNVVEGPAILQEDDSTTLVPPGVTATVEAGAVLALAGWRR